MTKNKKNQKVKGGGHEIAVIVLVSAAAGMLADIILSFLHISLSSRLANFVDYVVILVTFFSALMYFIGQGQEAR